MVADLILVQATVGKLSVAKHGRLQLGSRRDSRLCHAVHSGSESPGVEVRVSQDGRVLPSLAIIRFAMH